MIKVLILSDDFPPRGQGGAAAVAANIARGMKDRGYEIVIITSVRDKIDAGQYEYEGMKVYAFASAYHPRWRAYLSLYNPQAISFVKKILEIEKPDIVHAHNIHYYISYHALKLANKFGARVVLTAHDCMLFHYGKFTEFINLNNKRVQASYNYHISQLTLLRVFRFRYNPFRNILIRYYLKYVDSICAVSHEHKKVLESNGITNVHVVHNAIDVERWVSLQGNPNEFVKKYQIENFKRIIFAGRMNIGKGVQQLSDSLKLLKKKMRVDIMLVVIAEEDECTTKILAELEVAGIKTICTGWIKESELPPVYAAADVVVFPSICFDTFGMVIIEAMASKKPVVATCFGGAREIVKDGETGYIVNPYDTITFTAKLEDLLIDNVKKIRFGEEGFKLVVELFDLKKQIDTYESVYRAY